MRNIIVITILAALLTSCGIIERRNPSDPNTNAESIYASSKLGSILALTAIGGDDTDKKVDTALSILRRIDEVVIPLLGDAEGELNGYVYDVIIDALPPEYALLIEPALDVFNAHYKLPNIENPLTSEQKLYLKAFTMGLRDGAIAILRNNGVLNVEYTFRRVE